MEARKLILATVLATVAMLLLSFLWHALLMADFHRLHLPLMRDQILWRLIVLGYFVLAALMAVVYPKGYEGGPPWLEGARFGVIMGLLFVLPRGLVIYGVEGSQTGTLLLVDTAWHVVEQAAGGLLIGVVHGGAEVPDPEA